MNFELIKSQIIGVLKNYPIKHASVFGSYSRNEQTDNSDVDILIEPSGTFTLFQLLKLERELSKSTSRKIDLVEYSAIKASIRERVLAEAISIL
jgi:predicted nucleotidyltransferase